MTYTQEQLNGMNAEQLKAVILELQGQQTTAVMATTIITKTDDLTTAVQSDIDKIEAKIASLKEDGEDLYSDAIAALEVKRDALIVEAKAEIKEVETKVDSFVDQFRDKYLPWVQGVAVVIVVMKVFGVI